ncbi:unnamed protein product [Durusdinium trenchii]|uniref:Uncharacterized protein n=1 Tax=Durusdinium trenchii TaxID=1381693 RepID=A0ABP0LDV8_9DINO
MGCAAGRVPPPEVAAVKDEAEEEVPTTWASKPPQVERPQAFAKEDLHSAATAEDGFTSPAGATSPPATGSRGPKPVEPGLVLSDPDDDDIEVICEGKNPQAVQVEEVRSVTEEPIARPAREEPSSPSARPVLSQQQLEEAAKMAEHRKRFDNQRYYQDDPGGGRAQPLQDVKAHESIMGVNSWSLQKGQDALGECLPGGIEEEVLAEVVQPVYRNNHQLFDDDEEMLMKEILDFADA